MDHMRPDFERDRHVLSTSRGGETHRVVEQRLGRADLDQQRRQAPEIGIKHREARVLAVEPAGT